MVKMEKKDVFTRPTVFNLGLSYPAIIFYFLRIRSATRGTATIPCRKMRRMSPFHHSQLFSYNSRFSFPAPLSASHRPWPLPLCLPLLLLLLLLLSWLSFLNDWWPMLMDSFLREKVWTVRWPTNSFQLLLYILGSIVALLSLSNTSTTTILLICSAFIHLLLLSRRTLPFNMMANLSLRALSSSEWQGNKFSLCSHYFPGSSSRRHSWSHLYCVQGTWIMSGRKILFIDI